MAQKIRDIAVKVGEYQKDGQTKGRYQNVGALMKNDDGGEFIILQRWFNPAGVINPQNKESVILSCFKTDRQGGGNQQQQAQQQNGQPNAYEAIGGGIDGLDDIPFAQHQRGMLA